MADQQMSARLQLFREFSNQDFLRGPVEINHHVAAKNQLEPLAERVLRLEQIQVLEPDVFAQRLADAEASFPLADPALEIAPEQFGSDRRQLLRVVNGLPGPIEDSG